MKLIITIDTEEDNWGRYISEGYSLNNIDRIQALQDMFDSYNVFPTYLVTYPVATDESAVSILKNILDRGGCEIGTHAHPWNTPPFEEEASEYNSMLCNLPADLQYRKIKYLHEAIQKSFDINPVCFRSGRWSYGPSVAFSLQDLGYAVDTSLTPYTDWTRYHGPDFTDVSPIPFKFSCDDIFKSSLDGNMMEIPATIGFLQSNFARCGRILKTVRSKPFAYFKLVGILYKLNIVNKVWLSPETTDSKTMIKLANNMLRNNHTVINMVFHSPTLMAGLTPFVRTKADEASFLKRIREFLVFANDNGIGSVRLSDSLEFL